MQRRGRIRGPGVACVQEIMRTSHRVMTAVYGTPARHPAERNRIRRFRLKRPPPAA
ncbi:MAG: hypothetical protein VCE91_14330 [Nitrospinota bacterium]